MALQFEARTNLIATARHWIVEQALGSGVQPSRVPLITLLGSELVTNAVLHGPPGGSVTVRVLRVDAHVRVEVDDEGADPPRLRRPESTETSGRGILLIETLASRWGCDVHDGTGKTVWFDVRAD